MGNVLKKSMLVLVMSICSILVLAMPVSAKQVQSVQGVKSYNMNYNDVGGYWASVLYSNLFLNSDGTLTRIEASNKNIIKETYSQNFNRIKEETIPYEYDYFGGAYSGNTANYLVFGNNNMDESDTKDVFIIVKYTKEWDRIDSCVLRGCNTAIPFSAGSLRFAEYGNKLYIRTCHEMYKSGDGINHQANVMIEIDTDKMEVLDSQVDISWNVYGYVSHSFNQFVKVDGDTIIGVDHGDGHPRGLMISRYQEKADSNELGVVDPLTTFTFPGEMGRNFTGCGIGGFEISSSSYIIAGNYNSTPEKPKNVFLNVTSKSNFTESGVSTRYLTNYPDDSSMRTMTPSMVKINDNRFMIIWSSYDDKKKEYTCRIHYRLVDGEGNPITNEQTMRGRQSDCQPILVGDQIVWYYTKDSTPIFCGIPADGSATTQDNSVKGVDEFKLTVDGKDSYNPEGQRVAIMAESKSGMKFDKWKVISGKATFDDINSANTTITISGEDTVIEATYSKINTTNETSGQGTDNNGGTPATGGNNGGGTPNNNGGTPNNTGGTPSNTGSTPTTGGNTAVTPTTGGQTNNVSSITDKQKPVKIAPTILNNIPVNKKTPVINANKIKTIGYTSKKKVVIKFPKVKNAKNYIIAFKRGGDKKWSYYTTGKKTSYTINKLKLKSLLQFKVASYDGKARSKWSNTSYRYLAVVKGTVKAGKKKITIKFKPLKGATSYRIFYSTKKNMKGQKSITVSAKKKSVTIKKLKSGKKYYVMFRPLKKSKGKLYHGVLAKKRVVRVK